MKKRPLLIWIVGLGLILAPFYYYLYVEVAWADSGGLGKLGSIPARIGVRNLFGILVAPIVGFLVLRVRPIGWYAAVGYALYTLAANAVMYQQHHMAGRFLLFNAVGIACVLLLLRREIRSPYFNPRLRWWETPARYRLSLGVRFAGKEAFSTTTFDISDRGCFVATDQQFRAGERVDLSLDIGGTGVQTPGSVAWISDGSHHPKGVGIRFDQASSAIAKELSHYTVRQPRFEVAVPVRIEVEGKEPLTCTTIDISSSGCFVKAETPLAQGQHVQLTLDLESGPASVPGRVAWVSEGDRQPRGMGIQFVGRPAALVQMIKKLKQKLPEKAPLTSR